MRDFEYDDWINFVGGLVLLFILIISITAIMAFRIGEKNGYKQGQIDAINGSVYWRLERQPDGEMLWVSCDEICANSAEDR